MDILTIKLASEKWGISTRRISALCEQGRIPGAVKTAGVWLLPPDSQKPADARVKNEKYIGWRNKMGMSSKDYKSNIKNVKFDMIIIFDQIEEDEEIKKVVRESKYVLLNSDYKENLKLIDEHTNSYVITFGYNSRASITIISNENDEIILEIQREIDLAKNKKIECQEIKMNNNFAKKYIYEEIAMKILTILLKI